jgi:hypothetical protein
VLFVPFCFLFKSSSIYPFMSYLNIIRVERNKVGGLCIEDVNYLSSFGNNIL